MKQTLKRLAALLLLTLLMTSLCACGSSSSDSTEDETEAQWKETIENFVEEYAGYSDEEKESLATNSGMDFYQDAADVWESYEKELGDYKGIESSVYSENGTVVSVEVVAQFENKDCTINVMVDTDSNQPTSFTMEPEQTLGEKMAQAAKNTVVGVAIVFIVLIFLSLVISLFRFIPQGGKKEDKSKGNAVQTPAVVNSQEEELTDDLELIAVISAAIAASENTSTDSFVVRSVKKVRRNNWKRS